MSHAEVIRITDETGVCPVCEATAVRVELESGDVALYWPHLPSCPGAIAPEVAVLSEAKPIDGPLRDWEKKLVDG